MPVPGPGPGTGTGPGTGQWFLVQKRPMFGGKAVARWSPALSLALFPV